MSDLSLILWAQSYAHPVLTTFFRAITSLGSLEFYMLTIPIIYWLISKHFGFRFTIFFIFSAYLNSGMKHLFATERPPGELHLVVQDGYSFPSGHAQGSTVFWGILAKELKTPKFVACAAVMIFLISFSRVYLGVHWPIDILAGFLLGLVILYLYSKVAQRDLRNLSLQTWLLASVALALILYLIQPVGDGPMAVGFMLGAMIGYRLELIYVNFQEQGNLKQNISKLTLGLTVLFALRLILKPLLFWLPGSLAVLVRYSLLGVWASLGAPFTFMKLGLYKKTTL